MRIHHSCLVRRDSVDLLFRIRYKNGLDGYGVVRVQGHEYRFSRSYWRKLMRQRRQEGAPKAQVLRR
ncbi:hypothetical protein D3C80_1850350 [compost metagenome]